MGEASNPPKSPSSSGSPAPGDVPVHAGLPLVTGERPSKPTGAGPTPSGHPPREPSARTSLLGLLRGSRPPPARTPAPPAAGVKAGTDDDPLIGTVLLDRVRIVRPIARGGMGKVYLGEQVRLKRPCAIKILDPRMGGEADVADFTRRFLLEASIASKLTHPNVVTIFDYGETADGRCFIAMEYLEGRSLSDELKAVKRLPPDRAVHIARQAARALREAHALGVVHRDMKPGNVFLVKRDDDEDTVKVLDFGLVKDNAASDQEHTQLGRIMGSPRYMAPEQVQGKPVDARTDVYAIGAMLYAMLIGRPPFDKPTELAAMLAHVSDPPPPFASVASDLAMPAGLESIVMKCLAKKPEDRFASMEELIAALKLRPEGAATTTDSGPQGAPRLAPPVISVEPPKAKGSRVPWIVAGVATASVALVVSVISSQGSAFPAAPSASSAPPLASSAPLAPAVTAPAASASALPAAVKVTAVLHVETDPSGVKVKEEGETMCEATPCDIVYSGAEADPSYEHLLTFLLADYRLEHKLVKTSATPITVKMQRAR